MSMVAKEGGGKHNPRVDNQLLKVKAASSYLGVSISTLHVWDRRGVLKPSVRILGTRYYRRDQLEALCGGK